MHWRNKLIWLRELRSSIRKVCDRTAWLLVVAPHVSVDYNADFFVKELGRLVEISPLEVGEVFVALLGTYQPSYDFEDKLKNLVTKLAERPETRPHALGCAERLRYVPGMVQLYAQISDPTRVGDTLTARP
jgi:hypothetical protein